MGGAMSAIWEGFRKSWHGVQEITLKKDKSIPGKENDLSKMKIMWEISLRLGKK